MATPLTPPVVYGVVDLYGMAVKVTIVHNNNHSDRLRRNNAILRALSPEGALRRASPAAQAEPERMLFHPNCGQKAAITHEGRTALRPQYGPGGGEKPAEGALTGLREGRGCGGRRDSERGRRDREGGSLRESEGQQVDWGQQESGRHRPGRGAACSERALVPEAPRAVPSVPPMTSITA